MARDGSGTWIPLAPVVGGTIITSTWANNMMTSFGADITESLDRSGRGGMLVPFRIADGTKAEPGYSWTAELSTGFYRDLGGFDMRVSIGGVDTFRWNANGAQLSLDDGVNWNQVLTAGGATTQVPVNIGTVQGQTLRWDEDTTKEWQATSSLVVTDAGDVGIGTLDPASFLGKLTVIGNIAIGTGGTQYFYDALNSWGATIGTDNQGSYPGQTFGAYNAGSPLEYMRIVNEGGFQGNVGINEVAPAVKLHVSKEYIAPSTGGIGADTLLVLANNNTASGPVAMSLLYRSNVTGRINFGSQIVEAGQYIEGGPNYLAFGAGLGSVSGAERVRIDSAGNTSVGSTAVFSAYTTGTLVKFSVEKSAAYAAMGVKSWSATAGQGGVLVLAHSSSAVIGTEAVTVNTSRLGIVSFEGVNTALTPVAGAWIDCIQSGAAGASFIPADIKFFTGTDIAGPAERMIIRPTGEVGINYVAPEVFGTLTVRQKVDGKGIAILDSSATNALFIENDGTICNFRNNDSLPFAWFGGASGTTRHMTLDSAGNLLVGTTTPLIAGMVNDFCVDGNYGAAGSVVAIKTDGNAQAGRDFIRFINKSNVEAGSIEHDAEASVAYLTSSDYRLKKDAATLVNGLDRVLALNPVSYTWIADDKEGEGFLAHELQEHVPHAVSGEKDAERMQSVDYSRLTPVLVKAIQELTTRLEALEGA